MDNGYIHIKEVKALKQLGLVFLIAFFTAGIYGLCCYFLPRELEELISSVWIMATVVLEMIALRIFNKISKKNEKKYIQSFKCEYCGAMNKRKNIICSQCGAPLKNRG